MSVTSQFPDDNTKGNDLKLLHLVWEDPAKVVGGMGVAAASLCKALGEKSGVRLGMITPSSGVKDGSVSENSYLLGIDVVDAQQLQEGVERQLDLVGIKGAVADFTQEVYTAMRGGVLEMSCSVVHAHDWMTAAAGVSVQRAQGVPLILHVHSTQVDREGAYAQGAVFQHEKWAMEQADVVIAVSHYTKQIIIEHYGISGDKIRVVRNASEMGGADVPVEKLSVKAVVEKAPLVMFAGRLVGQKYPEAAVEIMAGALKRVEAARGVIAGGGDRLEAIRGLVKFKGMDERIEVLGSVPQRNMGTIYDGALVLILPSISEPFGLVAVEAARAGVAVMVSDRCGVSELMPSARVNDVYDTDAWVDDLVELLENKELREAQVKQQLLEVESYDWSDAGDAVLGIARELLGR